MVHRPTTVISEQLCSKANPKKKVIMESTFMNCSTLLWTPIWIVISQLIFYFQTQCSTVPKITHANKPIEVYE